jgi:carbonic anhydrase
MELTYDQIFENNRLWVAEKKASDSDFFVKLSREHNPDYLYIGCCDSRVPAEILMGAEPGEVFVHRNIANQVALSDRNVTSVIHFAVEQLEVKHIVVCGHYMCGGIQAAMKPSKNSPLDPWLDQVREVAQLNSPELENMDDAGERYRRLVELNVEAQCRNVLKLEVVQEAMRKTGTPSLHAWVLDLHTGQLIDLDFRYDLSSI